MSRQDARAIGAQIRMRLPQLTPLTLKVVDTFTSQEDLTDETPIKQVANDASASEAMIVKIAQKLGFSGIGGSAQMARDMAHKFLRIGIRTNAYDNAHMMLMPALVLKPDDAVTAKREG